jgi:hypothetical protein
MDQTQINKMVRVVDEDVQFSIASMQNVMRATWYNNAWESQGEVLVETGRAG